MKYLITFLVLALITSSCVIAKEAEQFDVYWVTLIDIRTEWRVLDGRDYSKRIIYVYQPPKGINKELSYPLNNCTVIGSKHLFPIKNVGLCHTTTKKLT